MQMIKCTTNASCNAKEGIRKATAITTNKPKLTAMLLSIRLKLNVSEFVEWRYEMSLLNQSWAGLRTRIGGCLLGHGAESLDAPTFSGTREIAATLQLGCEITRKDKVRFRRCIATLWTLAERYLV
jgi:hypothetical protein